MRFRKTSLRLATIGVVAAAIFGTGTPVAAKPYDDDYCHGFGSGILCDTRYIQPHSTQKWLRIKASGSGCILTWKLRRESDKYVVRFGHRG